MKDDRLISLNAAIDALNKKWRTCIIGESLIRDAGDTLKTLPSAQRWIPCKTKFPEKDGSYLVTANNGQIAIFLFVKGMSENYWKQWGATAWMPLPAPYIPEGDDKHEG